MLQHDPEKWTSVFQPKDEGGLRLLDVADLELVESADISVGYTRRGDPSELIPVLARLAAH